MENRCTWMGIGIFERLYSEAKLKSYFNFMDSLPGRKMFVLVDEPAGTNSFVLAAKKFDPVKDGETLDRCMDRSHENFTPKFRFINSLIKSSPRPAAWDVRYWDVFSHSAGYVKLLDRLKRELELPANDSLKKEVIKSTIFGFGARMRKNFTASFVDMALNQNFYAMLKTLSLYTVEEVASTLLMAQKGWVKAGHNEEKPYDRLTLLFYERFGGGMLKGFSRPEFCYIDPDITF